MKGLLKNNFFAVCANAKVFSIFMISFGVFVVAVVSQSLLIGYVMIGMVGFSVNAAAVAKNEFSSKWGKYKLTLPVRRIEIVRSLFWNQIIWLVIGTFFAGMGVSLSWLLHGCPFDQAIDTLTMFALGISMSLFMGAVFFPLFYLVGEERSEVLLIISLLCAFCINFVIISIMNDLLDPGIIAVLAGNAVMISSSISMFALSYWLTVEIFKRKEY